MLRALRDARFALVGAITFATTLAQAEPAPTAARPGDAAVAVVPATEASVAAPVDRATGLDEAAQAPSSVAVEVPANAVIEGEPTSGDTMTKRTSGSGSPAGELPPNVPALAAAKQDSPLIAVLDLRASDGASGLASALATVITAELNARDDVRAVSRSEIQAILAHKADQALLGCESVKCAADLGKLVEADLVIVGSIEQVAQAYVFSLSLVDPVVPEVKERVEATWRSGPDEIVILARPYVDRLLGGANAGSYVGALDVLAPDGATVFVDGKEVG
ncbi:MAG: hypothetical protein ACO3JL_14930, partial [Myxococcota bacterium]